MLRVFTARRRREGANSRNRRPEAPKKLERVKGIEPSYSAWKAAALPLSYTRAALRPSAGGREVALDRISWQWAAAKSIAIPAQALRTDRTGRIDATRPSSATPAGQWSLIVSDYLALSAFAAVSKSRLRRPVSVSPQAAGQHDEMVRRLRRAKLPRSLLEQRQPAIEMPGVDWQRRAFGHRLSVAASAHRRDRGPEGAHQPQMRNPIVDLHGKDCRSAASEPGLAPRVEHQQSWIP